MTARPRKTSAPSASLLSLFPQLTDRASVETASRLARAMPPRPAPVAPREELDDIISEAVLNEDEHSTQAMLAPGSRMWRQLKLRPAPSAVLTLFPQIMNREKTARMAKRPGEAALPPAVRAKLEHIAAMPVLHRGADVPPAFRVLQHPKQATSLSLTAAYGAVIRREMQTTEVMAWFGVSRSYLREQWNLLGLPALSRGAQPTGRRSCNVGRRLTDADLWQIMWRLHRGETTGVEIDDSRDVMHGATEALIRRFVHRITAAGSKPRRSNYYPTLFQPEAVAEYARRVRTGEATTAQIAAEIGAATARPVERAFTRNGFEASGDPSRALAHNNR